ncbi:MAG: DUF721 domain-containing protein [Bacteroidetes bacterium]|nr:DUF721 domain-containing protein [Bacteroidota bacterium]MBK9320506.1 DUF721 domain-containing protein [Bacteroidota bacterium]MBK9399324.1 DUF721 domain-containing protein [Bacteroidota bacterium]MBL0097690.1 DUF721 domain-containing protein [Bacteroidota bacterium]
MRPTNENSIGNVITEMLKKYRLEDGLWSAKIEQAWANCLSEYIVQRTTSLVFRNGHLQVYVSSSVIRKELLMMKADILNQLNEELGSDIIQEISVL